MVAREKSEMLQLLKLCLIQNFSFFLQNVSFNFINMINNLHKFTLTLNLYSTYHRNFSIASGKEGIRRPEAKVVALGDRATVNFSPCLFKKRLSEVSIPFLCKVTFNLEILP